MTKSDRANAKKLKFDGVRFPVRFKNFDKIEEQNSLHINVFGYEGKQAYPIRLSKMTRSKGVNLHYVLMRNFNRFMYNITNHKEEKHFCMHCLQHFSTNEILEKHKEDRMVINGRQAVRMPSEKGKWMRFLDFKKRLGVPFVVYADFESIVKRVDNPKGVKTQQYQKHRACGYALKVGCCYSSEFSKPVEVYRGEDATRRFIERVLELKKEIMRTRKEHFNKPITMSRGMRRD